MPSSLIVQLLSVLTFVICVSAVWKGGLAERIGAGIILASLILQAIADQVLPLSIQPVFRLVTDGCTAIGLLVVTVYSGSFWLGGAMLLYAAQFTLHSYYFVANKPNDRFHAVVSNATFLGISICLALGTLISWRQRVQSRRAASLTAESTSSQFPKA